MEMEKGKSGIRGLYKKFRIKSRLWSMRLENREDWNKWLKEERSVVDAGASDFRGEVVSLMKKSREDLGRCSHFSDLNTINLTRPSGVHILVQYTAAAEHKFSFESSLLDVMNSKLNLPLALPFTFHSSLSTRPF